MIDGIISALTWDINSGAPWRIVVNNSMVELGVVAIAILAIYVVVSIGLFLWEFINDEEHRQNLGDFAVSVMAITFLGLFGAIIISAAFTMIEYIAAVGLGVGLLYGARGLVRLKKQLNKHMADKNAHQKGGDDDE